MNILKLNVVVFSSLLFLLFAVVDTAAGDDYADGKLGKALILGGNSFTVRIPHYAGLKPAKAITISAWIKPEKSAKASGRGRRFTEKKMAMPEPSWRLVIEGDVALIHAVLHMKRHPDNWKRRGRTI
jgi:hypothetical protein